MTDANGLIATFPDELITVELAECERIIERGIKSFVDTGNALQKVRKRRLYRTTHNTFEDYCRERWGFDRSRADQLIEGAELTTIVVKNDAPAPVNEGQARALQPLKDQPQTMAEVMVEVTAAAEAAGTRVTAKQISEAVKARTTEDNETIIEVDGEGIVLGNPDLIPKPELPPELPPITKPDLGDGISHPARYSHAILQRFEKIIRQAYNCEPSIIKVLDPFAGTGRIHELPFNTTGIELEPEWSQLVEHGNIIGDATALPFNDETFHVVATSPTYGNRLADHHQAADPHLRRSYTHDLGRPLTDGNTGDMQWGHVYRSAHVAIWTEVRRVMKPYGWLLLNIKDHIRNSEQQPVSHWHTATLIELGFTFMPGYSSGVATQHLRQGSTTERAGQELVLVFRKV
jgi:hypothetical protein